MKVPAFGLLLVAQDQRLLEAEGLDVTFVPFPSGRDALAATLDGRIEVAPVYPTPVAIEALAGRPVGVIALVGRTDGLTGMAIRPGTGIETVSDLAGKKVGATPRTSSALFADILLAEAGVHRDRIAWTYDDQARLVARLKSGELDAAALWEPNLLLAQRGSEPMKVLTTDAFSEMGTLATTRALIERRRPALTRMMRGLLRAQAAIEARPALVEESLLRREPELTKEEVALLVRHGRFEVTLSNLLLAALRTEASWLEQNGVTRSPGVRMRNVIVTQVLEEVAPEAVTVLPVEAPQLDAGAR